MPYGLFGLVGSVVSGNSITQLVTRAEFKEFETYKDEYVLK